ncbi:MAG: restriction endonuclease subunit S [Oscillospiraceae bacterium]|nr:restriction endonuclease subunit S [Oscillospiraceae bacterium]
MTQGKLTALKELKKAYLQQMFPQAGERVPRVRFAGFDGEWREVRLGEVTEMYSGGTPSVSEKKYYSGNIPFIRSAEINSNTTELFLSEEGIRNSSAKMVEVGTILYALYGATSGEVGRSKIKGAINQAVLAINPNEEHNSDFIAQWLRKQKNSIVSTYLQGGQGNLSASIIKDLTISLPSLAEQTAIGNFFRKLDELIALYQRKYNLLIELKKSYLQQMFPQAGERVPRVRFAGFSGEWEQRK